MFHVEVTDAADQDADAIYEWLKEHSYRGALNWWSAFQEALQSLRLNADSFALAPESSDSDEKLHEHFFKTRFGRTYRLVYVIRDKLVYVLRVRSTGQPLLSPDQVEFPNGD